MLNKTTDSEAPPFFKSWKRFYFVVGFNLIFLLVLFYVFTRMFE